MRNLRAATALLIIVLIGPHAIAAEGLVTEKPESGRFVETDQGFMVPYESKVPGTSITLHMEPIPGGKFLLGSADDEEGREDNEGPQVEIEVAPFWISKYEVRWSEYRTFMDKYGVTKTKPRIEINNDEDAADAFTIPTPLYDPSFTYALGEEPDQPAVTMSQYAAKQFTKWLSLAAGSFYRLPSEAEWEYACRAGSDTPFNFGTDAEKIDDYAWYYENAEDAYHSVGQKKPNAWGLHDMHGNVGEMVLDALTEDHYASLKAGTSAADAICWPKKMFGRVVKGGSWDNDPEQLRSAARAETDDWRLEDPNLPKSPWWFTDEEALTVGFRIMRPLDAPQPPERKKFWDADVEFLQEDVASRVSEGRGVYGRVEQP